MDVMFESFCKEEGVRHKDLCSQNKSSLENQSVACLEEFPLKEDYLTGSTLLDV